VLINYRNTPQIAQFVTLKQVFAGKLEPEWVKDRVVLIGVTAASIQMTTILLMAEDEGWKFMHT
jgi:CHASE2 domain-containing sensor protein